MKEEKLYFKPPNGNRYKVGTLWNDTSTKKIWHLTSVKDGTECWTKISSSSWIKDWNFPKKLDEE